MHGASDLRIIAYGNKSLTDREKLYCQAEKEALALVWAVEHFEMYLFGKDSFELHSWTQNLKHELCLQDILLLRGNKIVIPSEIRSKVLAAAHEGHPGIVAMKTRLRSKVWWPKIDKDAEKYVGAGKDCTLVSSPNCLVDFICCNRRLFQPL